MFHVDVLFIRCVIHMTCIFRKGTLVYDNIQRDNIHTHILCIVLHMLI